MESTELLMRSTRLAGLVLLLSATVLIGACAVAPPVSETETSARTVEQLAEARWQAIMERDFEKSYEFYSPGYRDTTRLRDYERDMARRPFRYLGLDVQPAECEGDRCEVRVRLTYQAVGAPMGQHRVRLTQDVTETWIRLEDQWWYARN